jgi:hypothetical protein
MSVIAHSCVSTTVAEVFEPVRALMRTVVYQQRLDGRVGQKFLRIRSVRRAVLEHAAASSVQGVLPSRLEDVRLALLRQEDSIIFALIERAQFLRNDAVYTPGSVPVPAYTPDGRCFTFFEYLLRDTEAVHGRIRRYTSPDEHAFFPDALPPMVCFHDTRRWRDFLVTALTTCWIPHVHRHSTLQQRPVE